ncbi:MAG: hypothetical protein ACI8W7_000338 [Gammaproteobacteria bacterium]|jgi:hypothetical protein
MAFFDHGGVSIYGKVSGAGRPLVLPHGCAQSTSRWYIEGYTDALKENYRC